MDALDSTEFRRQAIRLVDWIADYLDNSGSYPVVPRVRPGQIQAALPETAPREPEDFDSILNDFERILVPGLTHWNHPRFFAYFATSSSAPGILAEFLAAALNQQAMLWRTSPAATELESTVLGWLGRALGLPAEFEGVIYDTASVSTLHALAAARHAAVPEIRQQGMQAGPVLRVYCSAEAHSSIDKGVLLLGLGHQNLVRVPVDDRFRMRVDLLEASIAADLQAGLRPMAVVATVGTTSTTSVDPVGPLADLCARHGLWLHVDGAYGGMAGLVPELAHLLAGCSRADSMVVNPHKWLFTPFDLSAFYCRRMDVLREAFSLVPEYLRTTEKVRNLMDTGVQLGRRFRALKLWMIMRAFGTRGLAERLRTHVALAQDFAARVQASPHFELMAPTPLSVVCFRALRPGLDEAGLDRLNEALLEAVNQTGRVFLSHTRLHGRYTLRMAIGNLRTTAEDVETCWQALVETVRTRESPR